MVVEQRNDVSKLGGCDDGFIVVDRVISGLANLRLVVSCLVRIRFSQSESQCSEIADAAGANARMGAVVP